ncbi:MAG: SMI1/KNR4 family protein [Casimicrobium sp.]
MDKAIDVFEQQLGVTLPETYRAKLASLTATRPSPAVFDIPNQGFSSVDYFFPLLSKDKTETLQHKLRLYKNRIPSDYLPIARDPGGNLVLLCLKGNARGSVFFWDHELESDEEDAETYRENLICLAKSFDAFFHDLRQMREDEM